VDVLKGDRGLNIICLDQKNILYGNNRKEGGRKEGRKERRREYHIIIFIYLHHHIVHVRIFMFTHAHVLSLNPQRNPATNLTQNSTGS
jgi:hypothetical protein